MCSFGGDTQAIRKGEYLHSALRNCKLVDRQPTLTLSSAVTMLRWRWRSRATDGKRFHVGSADQAPWGNAGRSHGWPCSSGGDHGMPIRLAVLGPDSESTLRPR